MQLKSTPLSLEDVTKMSIFTRQKSISEEELLKFERALIDLRVTMAFYNENKIPESTFYDSFSSTIEKLKQINTPCISEEKILKLEEMEERIKEGKEHPFNFDAVLSYMHRDLIADAFHSPIKQRRHYDNFLKRFSSASSHLRIRRAEPSLRE